MRSFELRLNWAGKHREGLEQAVSGWVNTEPYAYVIKGQGEGVEKSLAITSFDDVPEQLALQLSDSLQNMRISLDYLAFALAEANLETPLPGSVAEGSEFPIFGPKPPSSAALKKRIGGIDPAAQAVIEGLQPCNGGQQYLYHPLWILRELTNTDKHRTLHVTLAAVIAGTVQAYSGDLDRIWSRDLGPVELGADLLRWKVRPAPSGEMDVRFNLGLGIAFDQTTPLVGGKPVLETLDRLGQFIKNDVFPTLTPFL